MSDQQPTNSETPASAQPSLTILNQYIKDLSFEVPGGAETFRKLNKAPDLPISLDVQLDHLEANVFEVALSFSVKGQFEGETVFIAELLYGGIVEINAQDETQAQLLLMVETPRLLFPFARNIIATVTRDGGFPPVTLQPIDFLDLFRRRMEAMNQKSAETTLQ